MLNIIVFFYFIPCQLELFIRSMKFYFEDFYNNTINILYTYSDIKYKNGYEKLFKIHNDSNIKYIKEVDNFKNHVISLINIDNLYTVFFVDDNVFKNSFSLKSLQFKLFTLRDDILTLSLRLHKNLTYCYPAKIRMIPPEFDNSNVFKWYGLKGDYGYPMSLDGHIFRTNDILELTKKLTFRNPNSYESILSSYPVSRPKMICFDDSIIINNPINKVQNFNNNIHGNVTANYLNDKFLDGYIIDFEVFKGVKNYSCHQEISINLIKKNE